MRAAGAAALAGAAGATGLPLARAAAATDESGAARPDAARAAGSAAGAAARDVAARLARGGVVIAFRHALAPGTFDPPGFRLGDCSTQRNLDAVGRAQAQGIGRWFAGQGLVPARVRSSPWCRCLDTARLAFGRAEPWAALGSPRGADEVTNQQSLGALRQAVAEAAAQPGRFEAWVTHMFVLADLTGESSASGEGLLLLPGPAGSVRVAGRLILA